MERHQVEEHVENPSYHSRAGMTTDDLSHVLCCHFEWVVQSHRQTMNFYHAGRVRVTRDSGRIMRQTIIHSNASVPHWWTAKWDNLPHHHQG